MPTVKAHKTRHHSNLRPKHKHTPKYLQAYWPYLPLLVIPILLITFLQPVNPLKGKVLPYATNMSREALLASTNQHRANSSESALELNKDLNQAAQAKAEDMAKRNYWSHTTPEGKAPWTFVSRAGYSFEKAGENLAYGFSNSQQVVAGWMNSATHRANILDSGYQDVGFGFAESNNYDNSGPATIVVAMYGTELGANTDADQLAPTTVTTSQQASYNSDSDQSVRPVPTTISAIQSLTMGRIPGIQYLVGMIMGAALMYLGVKHAIGLRRVVVRGERFIISHPAIDIVLLFAIIFGIIIVQSVGTIL